MKTSIIIVLLAIFFSGSGSNIIENAKDVPEVGNFQPGLTYQHPVTTLNISVLIQGQELTN